MEKINQQKGQILYDRIDSSDFYTGTAYKDSRSLNLNSPLLAAWDEENKSFPYYQRNVVKLT